MYINCTVLHEENSFGLNSIIVILSIYVSLTKPSRFDISPTSTVNLNEKEIGSELFVFRRRPSSVFDTADHRQRGKRRGHRPSKQRTEGPR